MERWTKQKYNSHHEIAYLTQEPETAMKNNEQLCIHIRTETKGALQKCGSEAKNANNMPLKQD